MIDKNKNWRPDHLEMKDTDGDGVIDLYDEDDDNDGIPDVEGTPYPFTLHARSIVCGNMHPHAHATLGRSAFTCLSASETCFVIYSSLCTVLVDNRAH